MPLALHKIPTVLAPLRCECSEIIKAEVLLDHHGVPLTTKSPVLASHEVTSVDLHTNHAVEYALAIRLIVPPTPIEEGTIGENGLPDAIPHAVDHFPIVHTIWHLDLLLGSLLDHSECYLLEIVLLLDGLVV